jgi:hypothetical protein
MSVAFLAGRVPREPNGRAYARRRPEETVLYRVVQENWESFRRQFEEAGESLPRHVIREFESFLRCGILAHGFLRIRCERCRQERLVALSCKRRGFCPSCAARRMSENAAYWVDHVLPRVPVRQWVLSVPIPLRFWMARNPRLLSSVLNIVIRAIARTYLRSARQAGVRGRLQTGSLAVVQRFGGAVNLNVHFHVLFIEGVYAAVDRGGGPSFHVLRSPSQRDVEIALDRIQRRVVRHLIKRGLPVGESSGEEGEGGSPSALLKCQEASVLGRAALGERSGKGVRRIGSFGYFGEKPFSEGTRCAGIGGFSLHADVGIGPGNRKRLEKLCRYLLRPPVAEGRLSLLDDGQVFLRVKRMWSDGTQALLFSPMELMERLVSLVPQPRIHLTRFHGVLAPHAAWREHVVPSPPDEPRKRESGADHAAEPRLSPRQRLRWSDLLKRVFEIDLTQCPDCGGSVKLVSVVLDRRVIRKILEHVGLPTDAPRVFPARAPPAVAPRLF